MNKLNEIFVESINKAVMSADVMTDINQKPSAYAAIAHAIAVYLKGTTIENVLVEAEKNSVEEELANLQAENAKVSTAIEETIVSHIEEEIKQTDEWTLPYDEHGIPYLNQEDFAIGERVIAYENALTPEIKAKKRELEIAQGQAVLNEDLNATETQVEQVQEAAQENVQSQVEQPTVEANAELIAKLEEQKARFGYNENPQILDNLYHNFTDGVHEGLANINPQIIEAFLLFIQDELNKAYTTLEAWKNSWITKEGLDALLSSAYGVQGATIETYVSDANIFWFLEYIELYNANAWVNTYKQQYDTATMNRFAQQYLEDTSVTIDNINDTNVVGFVYYIQSSLQQQ